MKIRFGYELCYSCPQPVPMILMLHAHSSRSADLLRADKMTTEPSVPLDTYIDAFGIKVWTDEVEDSASE